MITACMSRSWKVEVCQKQTITTGRRDDQSAVSSKEHVKYETTQANIFLSAAYQHDRFHVAGKRLQQRSQGPKQQQSTPSSNESSRGKKTPNAYDAIRDECMPPTGLFRGYCRLLLRPLRGATRKYRDIGRVEPSYLRLEFQTTPDCWDIFGIRGPHIPKYRVGGNSHLRQIS